MTSINNLPEDIVKYLICNFVDCDDVKSLLLSSKFFNVLNETQLDKIKNTWIEKNAEIILEPIYCDSVGWPGTGGNYQYKKIYGKKQGSFKKNLTYIYGCVRQSKTINGNYKNDKLHANYNVYYSKRLSRCYSCGNKKLGTEFEFEGSFNFNEGKLLSFEIKNNDLIITEKGICMKENKKIENNKKENNIDEETKIMLEAYNKLWNNIEQTTMKTQDIISLLEFEEIHKVQICNMLNIEYNFVKNKYYL